MSDGHTHDWVTYTGGWRCQVCGETRPLMVYSTQGTPARIEYQYPWWPNEVKRLTDRAKAAEAERDEAVALLRCLRDADADANPEGEYIYQQYALAADDFLARRALSEEQG